MDVGKLLNKGETTYVQENLASGIKSRRLSNAREQDTRSPTPSGLALDSEYSPLSQRPSTPLSASAMSEHTHFSQMQLPPQQSMNGYPVQFGLQMLTQPMPQQAQYDPHGGQGSSGRSSSENAHKAFACSTCQKAFARRSDLARHERIHTGVRPHVCDHPGCGKQFIQRSALTVHSRVHTGEKPHMCDTCTKCFSDSSSLARHRRIHSGRRPYKCPYADCQKTFTRRTTLTRHQNHHTGSLEAAQIATAATLATRPNVRPVGRPPRSPTTEPDSGTSSMNSTPSPSMRSASMSPASGPISPFDRSNFMFQNITSHPLPGALHTRDLQPLTPGPTPTTTPISQSMVQGMSRPPTSNPGYAHMALPPLSIAPSPMGRSDDQRSASPYHGSLPGSPHMSHMGSPQMPRGSPHLSSMGYSPSYPSTNQIEEPIYFPSQPY